VRNSRGFGVEVNALEVEETEIDASERSISASST